MRVTHQRWLSLLLLLLPDCLKALRQIGHPVLWRQPPHVLELERLPVQCPLHFQARILLPTQMPVQDEAVIAIMQLPMQHSVRKGHKFTSQAKHLRRVRDAHL